MLTSPWGMSGTMQGARQEGRGWLHWPSAPHVVLEWQMVIIREGSAPMSLFIIQAALLSQHAAFILPKS